MRYVQHCIIILSVPDIQITHNSKFSWVLIFFLISFLMYDIILLCFHYNVYKTTNLLY
jgi:hypothetical protein